MPGSRQTFYGKYREDKVGCVRCGFWVNKNHDTKNCSSVNTLGSSYSDDSKVMVHLECWSECSQYKYFDNWHFDCTACGQHRNRSSKRNENKDEFEWMTRIKFENRLKKIHEKEKEEKDWLTERERTKTLLKKMCRKRYKQPYTCTMRDGLAPQSMTFVLMLASVFRQKGVPYVEAVHVATGFWFQEPEVVCAVKEVEEVVNKVKIPVKPVFDVKSVMNLDVFGTNADDCKLASESFAALVNDVNKNVSVFQRCQEKVSRMDRPRASKMSVLSDRLSKLTAKTRARKAVDTVVEKVEVVTEVDVKVETVIKSVEENRVHVELAEENPKEKNENVVTVEKKNENQVIVKEKNENQIIVKEKNENLEKPVVLSDYLTKDEVVSQIMIKFEVIKQAVQLAQQKTLLKLYFFTVVDVVRKKRRNRTGPWKPELVKKPRYVLAGGTCWMALAPLGLPEGVSISNPETWKTVTALAVAQLLDKAVKNRVQVLLSLTTQPDGDYHVEDVKTVLSPTWFAMTPAKKRELLKGRMTGKEAKEKLFADPDKLVGVNALDAIEIAGKVNAATMAQTDAANQYRAELNSAPTVRERLSEADLKILTRNLGYEVRCLQMQKNFSGHATFAAQRSLARDSLRNAYKDHNDINTALHVGATAQELTAWWACPGHDFYLHLSEEKDVQRMTQALVRLLEKKLANAQTPSLTSVKGRTTRLNGLTLNDILEMLTVDSRKRVFTKREEIVKQYNILFFEDCAYGMTTRDVCSWFEQTSATSGHMILFCPDQLVDDQAAASDEYLFEQKLPAQEKIEELMRKFWPEILLGTSLVPHGEVITNIMIKFTNWCLEQGAELLRMILTAPTHNEGIMSKFFGPIFEMVKFEKIVMSLLKKCGKRLWNALSDTLVTWSSGSGNGYRHNTSEWRKWIYERQFESGNTCIATELKEQHGEMWLYDMYPTVGRDPITYTVKLQKHKSYVRVVDMFESFNFGTRRMKPFPTYVHVRADDWGRIVNWALAEPIDSLSFGVMMTTINRVRKGLSLGENVIVPAMAMEAEDVKKIAIAAYLYVAQQQDLTGIIESDKDLKAGYQSRIKKLLTMAGASLMTILTGGAVIPLYYVANWLLTGEDAIEIVQYQEKPRIRMTKPTVNKWKERIKPVDMIKVSVCLPHRSAALDIPCFICQLQALGCFSMDGNPANGQMFHLTNHDNDAKYELRFTPERNVQILNKFRDAKVFHRGVGATALAEKIASVERYFETMVEITDTHILNVHRLRGGPGVGKSTIIRAMSKKFESAGKKVVIGFPFKELGADYKQASVIGYDGKHDFISHTTWFLCGEQNIDVLFIDEASSMDNAVVAGICKWANVKELYVVGDEAQTHLNFENGEGLDLMEYQQAQQEHFFNLETAPTHTCVINYRNPAYITKLLNFRLGYKLESLNTNYEKPKFLTTEQYQQYKLAVPMDREMVFSHASAQPIFGRESDPNVREPGANISVRSCQGKTFEKTAVAVTQIDQTTIEARGMRCVGVSRHTDEIVFVAENWDDPIPAEFKRWMGCANDEDFDMIRNMPWPSRPKNERQVRLSPEDARLDQIIRRLNAKRKVEIEKHPSEESEVDEEAMESGMIIEKGGGYAEVQDTAGPWQRTALIDTWRTLFNWCFFEFVEEKFGLQHEIDKFLSGVYFNPKYVKMKTSLKGSFWDMLRVRLTSEELTVDSENKFLLPLDLLENFCVENTIQLALFDEETGKMVYRNEAWRTATDQNRDLNLVVKGKHVTKMYDPEMVHVDDVLVDPFSFVNGRRAHNLATGQRMARMRKEKLAYYAIPTFSGKEKLGYLPTGTNTLKPEHRRLATEHAEVEGSRGLEKPKHFALEKAPFQKQKVRAGTDAFMLADWVDPSDAQIDHKETFPHATVNGVDQKVTMKVNLDGLLGFNRTKARRLKIEKEVQRRAFKKGFAMTYRGESAETLVAAQRLGLDLNKPSMTTEAWNWTKKVADKYVEDNFNITPEDTEVCNKIVADALRDCRRRNYDGRTDAERKKDCLEEPRILVANKAQTKFKTPLDPMKAGQPLSMAITKFNLKFVPFFRKQGYKIKSMAKDHLFFDDYQNEEEFIQRVTLAIANLPKTTRFLVVDAIKFDSQQSEITFAIEYHVHRAFGAKEMTLDEYKQIRGPGLTWSLLGRAAGKTSGNKPSGLPDTKLGNDIVEGALVNYKYEGDGPKVVCQKGDDYLLAQANIRVNQQHSIEIEKYTGMRFYEKISDSASFIGYAVTTKGFTPDVVKRMYKALEARARDYNHFTEQQKAYRDFMQKVNKVGGLKAAEEGAVAIGACSDLGGAAYEVLNSLSHMSYEQWMKRTKIYKTEIYHPRGAEGPTLL